MSILTNIPEDWHAQVPNSQTFSKEHHLLGLNWNFQSDSFSFSVSFKPVSHPVTKRKVLSVISKIYDPLGLISPVIVQAKIFFQSLWCYQPSDDSASARLGWDDELPKSLMLKWHSVFHELCSVSDVSIPRWVFHDPSATIEIHGFGDASSKAIAAAVYIRVITSDNVKSTLLISKTKLAPVKTLVIPRLELCASVLLAKLTHHIIKVLALENYSVHLWSDSKDVLAWIGSSPHLWQTFVSHRIAEIQRLLPMAVWDHVEGKFNPADLASRGLNCQDLMNSSLWWNGPPFLVQSLLTWLDQ